MGVAQNWGECCFEGPYRITVFLGSISVMSWSMTYEASCVVRYSLRPQHHIRLPLLSAILRWGGHLNTWVLLYFAPEKAHSLEQSPCGDPGCLKIAGRFGALFRGYLRSIQDHRIMYSIVTLSCITPKHEAQTLNPKPLNPQPLNPLKPQTPKSLNP